jgi:hypothetical protein
MNPWALESKLRGYHCRQLRAICADLGLTQKGTKAQLVERLVSHHADPCCALEVVLAVDEVAETRARCGKRKRHAVRDAYAVENLHPKFKDIDVSAGQAPRTEAGNSGSRDSLQAATAAAPATAAPAMATPGTAASAAAAFCSSPLLVHVPAHLCPWQASRCSR